MKNTPRMSWARAFIGAIQAMRAQGYEPSQEAKDMTVDVAGGRMTTQEMRDRVVALALDRKPQPARDQGACSTSSPRAWR